MIIHQTTLVKGRRYLFEFGDRTPRNERIVVTFERVELAVMLGVNGLHGASVAPTIGVVLHG